MWFCTAAVQNFSWDVGFFGGGELTKHNQIFNYKSNKFIVLFCFQLQFANITFGHMGGVYRIHISSGCHENTNSVFLSLLHGFFLRLNQMFFVNNDTPVKPN